MKIATINDINQNFNVTLSETSLSKCVSKQFLEGEGEPFVINGDYADNQLVKLSDISRQSGTLSWGFGNTFIDATYVNTVSGWFEITDENGEIVVSADIVCPENTGNNMLWSGDVSFSQLKSNETYTLSFSLEGAYGYGETCPEAMGIYMGSYDDVQSDPHPNNLVLIEKISYDYLEYPDEYNDGIVSFSANTSFTISDLISTTSNVYDACIALVMLSDINDSW